MKKILSFIIAACLALLTFGCSGPSTGGKTSESEKDDKKEDTRGLDPFEFSLMNLCGTDGEGRRAEPVYGRREGKSVGIFYSVWLGQHGSMQHDIYDIEALLSTDEGTARLNSFEEGGTPAGEFHFCGEPLYGYYDMNDPWVINRHVELLTACGLDYLCLDATNAVLYQAPTKLLLDTLLYYNKQGFSVPKVMFYTNSESGTTATRIYNDFYQTDKYSAVWWAPNGKPMIVGITENSKGASDQTFGSGYKDFITAECKNFFDVRESQWPNGRLDFDNGFPWMSWQYPQKIHYGAGTISVSVAQHSPVTINFSDKHAFSSRGYDHETEILHEDYWLGQNFQSEWNTVFKEDEYISNVLVTSWNEWMAIKYSGASGARFVDVYNEEYSRDCEMSAGKNGDNFYMQLLSNVRKFKFTGKETAFDFPQMSIDVTDENSLARWNYVYARYKDFSGEVTRRDHRNASATAVYTDESNRNDVTDIKVVHNAQNLYFYVKTKEDITVYNGTDENWMNILISTGKNKGFEGYDFVINRHPKAEGKTSVERSSGGYNWQAAGEADYRVYGNVIVYAVPLSSLGLTAENCAIEFKVTDNITKPYDILDYYVSGESAPIGRLSFSYGR